MWCRADTFRREGTWHHDHARRLVNGCDTTTSGATHESKAPPSDNKFHKNSDAKFRGTPASSDFKRYERLDFKLKGTRSALGVQGLQEV